LIEVQKCEYLVPLLMKLPRILANLGAPPQQRHEAEEMKWNLEHV
jgi:hypothetical protein